MATVRDALRITRTLLNDDASLQWHDSVLMPKVQQAFKELLSKAALNGLPCIWERSTLITVPANAVDLGTNQPSDIVRPIKMDERKVGDLDSNAIPMTQLDFPPNLDKTDTLRYWSWYQERIVFLGCTATRQIRLYYTQLAQTPGTVNDPLFLQQSETFIGPRVAALCSVNLPNYQLFVDMADKNLDLVVRREVRALQALPVRKRPFSFAIKARRRFTI